MISVSNISIYRFGDEQNILIGKKECVSARISKTTEELWISAVVVIS